MQSHKHRVTTQFNANAGAYLDSQVHKRGPDLDYFRQLITQWPNITKALDLGCGAGHISFLLSEVAETVEAVDASEQMLQTFQSAAKQRQLKNIRYHHANAERLPFADNSMDLVCSRYSAHHWTQLDTAMYEMRRVLKPGGHIVIIDIQGFENPLIDTFFQALEILRDPSHVRNRSDNEWQQLLKQNGLTLTEKQSFDTRLDFQSWISRMQTPEIQVAAIRHMQAHCADEVSAALKLEADGSFTAVTSLWAGRLEVED